MAAFHLSLSEMHQSKPTRLEEQPSGFDPEYAKSLIYSLQANLYDLKQEANNLKNATYRESMNSAVQTFRSSAKVIDYRKTPVPTKISQNPPIKEVKMKSMRDKEAVFEYPSYGRGVDPSPDLELGYMTKPMTNNSFAPMKKVIYEKNFEKFLTEKQLKSKPSSESRPFTWEEPQIIQYLRGEFLRMTRRSENRLMKTNFVDEVLKNPELGELFGVTEQIDPQLVQEMVDNIGLGDFISIDEFLQFYQISKNNLLKSRQIFLDEEKQKVKSKQAPDLFLKLEYLLDKFLFESKEEASKFGFIEALTSNLAEDILEILQIPPILYSSLEEFITSLEASEAPLSIDLLTSLFVVPEVLDYILPEDVLMVFEEIYNSYCSDDTPGVNTQVFISALMDNEVIQANLDVIARSPQGLPSIPEESLANLLSRIAHEAPEWLTWEEFLRFFSIEGRPAEEIPVTQTENKPPLGFRYKITVPAPFNFMRREQIKQPSIRERKLKEMMEKDEQKIDAELKNKFKAQPVPAEVKIPMYQQIMKEQEERRLTLKEHFEAITKSLERPFSFYYRDMAKPEIKQEELKTTIFHADPVPWFCKILLCEKLAKQEVLRKDRIMKIAKESLNHSKMPPRMEQAARSAIVKGVKNPSMRTDKAKTFKAKEVPDFKTLHENFSESLEALKQSYTPTRPTPFKFHVNQRSEESLKLLDFQAQALQQWVSKPKKRAASAFAHPKITPGTTQKTKDMMVAKQEYLQTKKDKQQEKVEEAVIRQVKHEAMKRLMKKSAVLAKRSANQEKIERARERKEQLQRAEVEYKMKLQEIREKVAQRPLLVEQIASSSVSKGFEAMEPVRRLMQHEYISEALTSQEQEVSSESFG